MPRWESLTQTAQVDADDGHTLHLEDGETLDDDGAMGWELCALSPLPPGWVSTDGSHTPTWLTAVFKRPAPTWGD